MVRTRRIQLGAVLLIAASLLACRFDRPLPGTPLVIPPGAWVSLAAEGLRTEGEQTEVCAVLPDEYRLSEVGYEIVTPRARHVHLGARLITKDGAPVNNLSMGFMLGTDQRVCFRAFGRPRGEEYREVQFLATDSLELRSVRWWSGNRRFAL